MQKNNRLNRLIDIIIRSIKKIIIKLNTFLLKRFEIKKVLDKINKKLRGEILLFKTKTMKTLENSIQLLMVKINLWLYIFFVLSILSISWLFFYDNKFSPPQFFIVLSWISSIFGIIIIIFILARAYKKAPFCAENHSTNIYILKPIQILNNILNDNIEYKNKIDDMKRKVTSKELTDTDDEYIGTLEDYRNELQMYKTKHLNEILKQYFFNIVLSISLIIFIFAFIYIVSFNHIVQDKINLELDEVSCSQTETPVKYNFAFNHTHSKIPEKFWIEWVIEGLYVSTVTFTTLGFGDIFPCSSIHRLYITMEVISFLIVFGIFLNHGLVFTKERNVILGVQIDNCLEVYIQKEK